jgi:hypothetical protein
MPFNRPMQGDEQVLRRWKAEAKARSGMARVWDDEDWQQQGREEERARIINELEAFIKAERLDANRNNEWGEPGAARGQHTTIKRLAALVRKWKKG